MSSPTGDTASSASEKPQRRQGVFALATACHMLPLVRRIVSDILRSGQSLSRLLPEKDVLDRQRRHLAWPERSRRYRLQEEIADLEHVQQCALGELESLLGVVLEDAKTGQVGFPTVINDRAAFFSWQPGDEGIVSWHFAGESTRRPIPVTWAAAHDVRPVHHLP